MSEYIEVLAPIISTAITIMFLYLTRLASSRMKAGAHRDAVIELLSTAEMVVGHVEQKIRPILVEAASDGQLTGNDYRTLKDTAMRLLGQQLSAEAKRLLNEHLEQMMSEAIESSVLRSKS